MIKRAEALTFHAGERSGKIEVRPTKSCMTPREIRLVYLPGATFPCEEIHRDIHTAFQYTVRGNLVGVITDGSGVPGMGDIGPTAAKPMLEGLAVILKRLADIDVFDLELRGGDTERFIETVAMLEPTFGAINLKDIKAPEGLYIFDELRRRLEIPIFHENLYSTAVVAVAALMNALELVEKRLDQIQVVVCGAGTVGIGCLRLLVEMGIPRENILVYDVHGLLHPGRTDLSSYQMEFVREDSRMDLEVGLKGADVFLGASAADLLTHDMIRAMNRFPIVLALATPKSEISYDIAIGSRRDIIVATGLGEHPNAALDILSLPYILRGALDVQATRITNGMLIAAARALADLAKEDVIEEVERAYGQVRFCFGPSYLLPKPIDPRILVRESAAVAQCAIREGVARVPIAAAEHEEALTVRIGSGRNTMRSLILRARQKLQRIVFAEGANDTILRACALLVEEAIAIPIVLGSESRIRETAERLGLDLSGITIEDVSRSATFETYAGEYLKMRWRRGATRAVATERMRQHDYYAAAMVQAGAADMMIAGISVDYAATLRSILDYVGPKQGSSRISSHHVVLLPKDIVLLADCTVNINPTEHQLAEIALQAAGAAISLGIEPRVAMLSFSNFGSIKHPYAKKVERAVAIVKQMAPTLVIDGEMQLLTARDGALRHEQFPLSTLSRDANVLVFPDLQSANLALQSLQCMGDAIPVGPILMGTRLPCHLLQYRSTVQEVVNLATIATVEAASHGKPRDSM